MNYGYPTQGPVAASQLQPMGAIFPVPFQGKRGPARHCPTWPASTERAKPGLGTAAYPKRERGVRRSPDISFFVPQLPTFLFIFIDVRFSSLAFRAALSVHCSDPDTLFFQNCVSCFLPKQPVILGLS